MQATKNKVPPILIRLVRETSALEALTIPLEKPVGPQLDEHAAYLVEKDDVDTYILSQFICAMYLRILFTNQTSGIYWDILSTISNDLHRNLTDITDPALNTLLVEYFRDGKLNIRLLTNVMLRLNVGNTTPLAQIAAAVLVAYGSDNHVGATISLYLPRLTYVEAFETPTLSLVRGPTITLATTRDGAQSPFWRLLNSISDQGETFDGLMYTIAQLAMPLGPADIVVQMREGLGRSERAGVPFVNYVAMYLKQQELGYQYSLSVHSDARRILMRRLHQFCGVGGTTYAYDAREARNFLNGLQKVLVETPSELEMFARLKQATSPESGMFSDTLGFGIEAIKTDNTDPTSEDTDDGAFDDDVDPTDVTDDDTTAQTTDDENTGQTTDNNIDRTSDVGQDSAAANKNAFIPLALPTETIDDHLLRRALLKYVSDMDKDPAPDITPELLSILKYWCDSWLFIASIDQTKKLLNQFKLTGQIKELVK